MASDLPATFHDAAARDAKLVRDVIDAALREWIARGVAADLAFSEAANAVPHDGDRIKKVYEEQVNVTHSESHCASWRESLRCCLDHEHEMYGPMIDFVAIKLVESMIPLPGWTCRCGSFNGSLKAALTECRSCGAPR